MDARVPRKEINMKKYMIWDWNGTIVDDVGIALDAVNDMLREKDRPEITLEEYRRAMDTPILRFYEEFFDMKETSFEWIADRFQSYYGEHKDQLTLHEGVEDLLKRCQAQGCHQIILSSSATDIITYYAELFGVSGYFEAVLGADDLLAAGKIQRAVDYFEQNKIPREEAVMIGDCVHDFDVSHTLGIDCVLMSGGHQDLASLEACGCPVLTSLKDHSSPGYGVLLGNGS